LGHEFCVGQKCCDQFCIDNCEFFGQGAVGGGERGDSLTIMGGCLGEIGNGVDGVLLVDGIVGLVVGGARSCALSIPESAMGFGEGSFELILSFVGNVAAFPKFAVFNKHTSRVH
jgi:hypothetical protein